MIDTREIEKLKKVVREKYDRKLKELEAEKQKSLEAIDIVSNLQETIPSASINNTTSPPAPPKTKQKKSTGHSVGVAGRIRDSVPKIGEDFDLNKATDFVEQTNPSIKVTRGNFHAAMRTMVKDGVVIVAEKGAGKRPAVYRYVGEKTNEQDEMESTETTNTQKLF